MTDMKFEEQYEQLVISQHPSKDCDKCIDIEAYTNCTKLMSTPNTIIIKFPSKKEALQMRDALLEALPIDDTEEIDIELPEEPEERGFYITDKNVLIDHCNGAWRAVGDFGDTVSNFWCDDSNYADWKTVCKTLGKGFELTHVSFSEAR